MFPVLHVGSAAIQVPGLLLLAGIWLGLTFSERYAWKFQIHPDLLYRLVLWMLLGGIAGARLTFAARFPQPFFDKPADFFSLNPGLLDPFGGFATAFILMLIMVQRNQMCFLRTLDSLVPFFATFQIALGLAALASGSSYGLPTELPWGIYLWGELRHPSQVYEIAAGIAVLTLLWPKEKAIGALPSGEYLSQFLALSAFSRLYLEAFRADSPVFPNGVRIIQLVAWIIAGAGLLGWYLLDKSRRLSKHG